jgi:hypothetical protein
MNHHVPREEFINPNHVLAHAPISILQEVAELILINKVLKAMESP